MADRNADTLLAALTAAINAACHARGDSDANRVALIAECSQLTDREQDDMRQHFEWEAAAWRSAAGAAQTTTANL